MVGADVVFCGADVGGGVVGGGADVGGGGVVGGLGGAITSAVLMQMRAMQRIMAM